MRFVKKTSVTPEGEIAERLLQEKDKLIVEYTKLLNDKKFVDIITIGIQNV